MASPGGNSDAKSSLDYLIELGKKRDTGVGISTLVAVDRLDIKQERQEGKVDYVREKVTEISLQVKQFLSARHENRLDNTTAKSTVISKRCFMYIIN